MDVSKHHWAVYGVAFGALITQAAFSAWFVFTVIATYAYWTPGNPCQFFSSLSFLPITSFGSFVHSPVSLFISIIGRKLTLLRC